MPEKLSEFVKRKRKALGITQAELADRAGVGLRFLRELENEKPTLRLDKVNLVLDMFGCEMGRSGRITILEKESRNFHLRPPRRNSLRG
ncbi:MAG: helix-turn-helix transcriptional regulator [Thermovirgaceae bacterium]|nr:helix-turn-helix transcriptional regulator [Thermovirgaceae bacterium]